MRQVTVNKQFDVVGADKTSFEHNHGLIKHVARRVYTRALAAGLSIDLEDLENETVIAWCKARDAFRPEVGARFSTYFMKAAFTHLNRVMEKEGHAHFDGKLGSLDETIGESEMTMVDTIADEYSSPEQISVATREFKHAFDSLSPQARFVVTVLVSPTEEIWAEFRAYQEQHKIAAKLNDGQYTRTTPDINMTFAVVLASKMFNLTKNGKNKLRRELDRLQAE